MSLKLKHVPQGHRAMVPFRTGNFIFLGAHGLGPYPFVYLFSHYSSSNTYHNSQKWTKKQELDSNVLGLVFKAVQIWPISTKLQNPLSIIDTFIV